MGGFSAQVQQPQASQPQGKNGNLGQQMGGAFNKVLDTASSNPQGFYAHSPQDYIAAPEDNMQPQQPMGKGGSVTNSATSGQPRMGQPNRYPNTVGQWDNIQIQQPRNGGGKGKG